MRDIKENKDLPEGTILLNGRKIKPVLLDGDEECVLDGKHYDLHTIRLVGAPQFSYTINTILDLHPLLESGYLIKNYGKLPYKFLELAFHGTIVSNFYYLIKDIIDVIGKIALYDKKVFNCAEAAYHEYRLPEDKYRWSRLQPIGTEECPSVIGLLGKELFGLTQSQVNDQTRAYLYSLRRSLSDSFVDQERENELPFNDFARREIASGRARLENSGHDDLMQLVEKNMNALADTQRDKLHKVREELLATRRKPIAKRQAPPQKKKQQKPEP